MARSSHRKPFYPGGKPYLNTVTDDPQIRLWVLRVLVPAGTYKQFVREFGFSDDDVARLVGLSEYVDGGQDAPAYDPPMIIQRLRAAWKEAEQRAEEILDNDQDRTLRRLGGALGLSEIDTDILRFRLAVEQSPELFALLGYLGTRTTRMIVNTLAICLNREKAEIDAALSPTGALATSGIVTLQLRNGWNFVDAISVLACLADEIHCDHDEPLIYFRSRIVPSPPTRLTVGHFPHAAGDLAVLRQYLGECVTQRRPGVNVLIHGEPGSGKTEFVRMLAADLGMSLYEVASTARDGRVLDADDRFRAYQLSQALLGNASGRLILFDEIEDVFRETDKWPHTGGNASSRKAWVNKLLEGNAVPAFWISNNIQVIDRAYLRRFDYVLEMNAPPRSVRGRILDEYLAGLPVSEDWKRRMAEHEGLVPAVVERAAKVLLTVRDSLPPEEMEQSLARVMGNTLEVMGLAREPRHAPTADGYRLDVLNTDCDLAELRDSLLAHRQGRLCLYGPPGTGKTAFGRYLADVLDRPLLLRRASDIVSPWLGMTEKNLARMFRQAREEGAVLLLDEADSFLQDRQGAQRSWEISQVNEMLTQMETFEGIFIVSTNLMSSLDTAALRRFDLKIEFDYLRPGQAWALFDDTATSLGLKPDPGLEPAMARLECLTPGDFANAVRQARLRRIGDARVLLDRLAAECAVKPEGRKRAMGFGG